MLHLRLANPYILRDLSKAVEKKDYNEAKNIFRKYHERYRFDTDLCLLNNLLLECLGEISNEKRSELKEKLKNFA